MSLNRIILSLYLAFVSFSLLQLVYGEKGFAAQDRLLTYEKALDAHLGDLEASHDRLSRRYLALAQDREAVKLEARRLGYYDRDEVVLELRGIPDSAQEPLPAKVMEYRPQNEYLDSFFRAVWVLLALFFYIALSLGQRYFFPDGFPQKNPRR